MSDTPSNDDLKQAALDYHRLPVRVRFLDREGRMSGEQLATSIRVSAE